METSRKCAAERNGSMGAGSPERNAVGGIQNRRLLSSLLHEFQRRQEVRDAIETAYETAPGPAYCVRRLEVVEHVARTFGIRVLNNDLFRCVEQQAAALGWESIRNGGRSLFRRAKRRGANDAEAMALSRANRRDQRYRPALPGIAREAR